MIKSILIIRTWNQFGFLFWCVFIPLFWPLFFILEFLAEFIALQEAVKDVWLEMDVEWEQVFADLRKTNISSWNPKPWRKSVIGMAKDVSFQKVVKIELIEDLKFCTCF